MRKGAHIVYTKENIEKIDDRHVSGRQKKLYGEQERVYEVAELVESELRDFVRNRWDDFDENKKISTIHLDYNSVEGRKRRKKYYKNESNNLLSGAISWLKSCGYTVLPKPYAWAASCSADKICNGKIK